MSSMIVRLASVGLLVIAAACASETEQQLIDSARTYLARKDSAAAEIELKRALEKNPSSSTARLLLARTLLEQGDPAAAELEYRKALDLGADRDQVVPELARTLLVLADPTKVLSQFASVTLGTPDAQAGLLTWVAAAHAQTGAIDRATATIDRALAIQPLHGDARMVKARLLADAGDVDGALRLMDEVLAANPDDEQAGIAKGYLLSLHRGDGAGALASHRRVLDKHPESIPARAEVVTLLFRQGEVDEARRQFEALRKRAPNHPETVFFEAQFAYIDRDYRRSRELLDTLLKGVPNHYRGLELAAAAEYQLGNDIQAQVFLQRALKLVPGLSLSRKILAQSLLRTGQPAAAVDALAPLLEGSRVDPEALTIAGGAWLQLGDIKRANAAYTRAGELAPNNMRIRTEVALAMAGGASPGPALKELEVLAAGDPGPRADLALVNARIAQADYRGALDATQGLATKLPGSPLPDQIRGQLQVALRDPDAARQSFQAALQKNPAYFPAVAALASLDVATGKPVAARDRLTEYLKRVPASSQAMLMLAEVPDTEGTPPADAAQWLVSAVRADPANARTHRALIAHHLRRGDRPAALAAAQAAMAAMPNDVGIMVALGQAQLVAGDSQQAVSTFRRVTALHPESAAYRMYLAEAQVAAGDLESAGRSLRETLNLDPERTDARRSLAMLALRKGRPEEALGLAREMQRRQPKQALGFVVEGDIEAQRRNWSAAGAAYQSALQREAVTEIAIKLHAVLQGASRTAEASRMAAEWLRQRTRDPVFSYYLGDVATRDRDYPSAEKHYRNVLSSSPDNAMAMNNIAWLLLQQRKDGALELAQRADRLLPNQAPILDTLAAALAATGKHDDAARAQRRAVAASPGDPNLKLRLAQYLIRSNQKQEARQHLDALARLGSAFQRQAEVVELQRTL